MTSPWQDELAIGRRFIEANPPPGPVVFCALSGAHLYGFPSPDSDLDLKGAYLADTRSLLGLGKGPAAFDLTADHEGVECDFTALELGKALALLIGGNGNTLEQLTGPHQVFETEALSELAELARGSVHRGFARHYRGFLKGLRRDYDEAAEPEVKKLLYGYRVAGTGIHLLKTGEVQADLRKLAPEHGLEEALPLIARKHAGGEHGTFTPEEKAEYAEVWEWLDARLGEALEETRLPESAPNQEAMEAWLVARRLDALP